MPLDALTFWHHGAPQGRPLIRLPDWESKLLAFINARQRLPILWGEHDAIAFAINVVRAMTGATVWPITWSTQAGANAAANAAGGLVEAWSRIFGEPSRDPASARRGDLVLVVAANNPTRAATAVCVGDNALISATKYGLERAPKCTGRLVWRVG